MASGKNKFAFIGGLVDPNSLIIKNNYVYFKYTNPKHLVKEVEESSIKVNQVTPAQQAKEIAESREEVESGKRKLPDSEVYDKVQIEPPTKRKRPNSKKQVEVYSTPDALDT